MKYAARLSALISPPRQGELDVAVSERDLAKVQYAYDRGAIPSDHTIDAVMRQENPEITRLVLKRAKKSSCCTNPT